MEFDLINGMYRVHREDPNTQNLLPPGVIPTNPQDMDLSQILTLLAGLISTLEQAEDKLQNLIDLENKLDVAIQNSSLDPALKEAIDKQMKALIERQIKLKQMMQSLVGIATGLEASGCKITSTSNPLDALTQTASTDLTKVQVLAKEAKALLKALDQVIFLNTVNEAIAAGKPIPYYIQTSIEGFQKTEDTVCADLDQKLQSLLKALENDAKKLTLASDHHLLTEPSKTPSQAAHSTQK